MKQPMHPSGLTIAEWRWPFKTPEQRKKIVKWFEKQQLKHLPKALV